MTDLIYTSDSEPGYSRRRCGRGFTFLDEQGERITDASTIKRIKSLVLPPAYREVWICANPNGHLQATGLDDRGRKQYRYHPSWNEARAETKFAHQVEFAKSLPAIRRRVLQDMDSSGLPKEKVIACAVRVLDHTGARIGSKAYRDENGTFGITTLEQEHLEKIDRETAGIRLSFTGKSNNEIDLDFRGKQVAEVLSEMTDLPGENLFQYEGRDGELYTIKASDVNSYLQTIHPEATAKDFRTWRASVLTFAELSRTIPGKTKAIRNSQIRDAVTRTAEELAHRVETCREYYIHPRILDSFLEGRLIEGAARFSRNHATAHGLSVMEEKLLEFLSAEPAVSEQEKLAAG